VTYLFLMMYKKGLRTDPGNYRGISLLSCVSKILTRIINNRMTEWANSEDKLSDIQAGFRAGKSTMDHVFVLQGLISKYLGKKRGRFYCVFVDFSKAFDSVPHKLLFFRLLKGGMHGNIVKLLQDMYSKLKSCVQIDSVNLSESFACTRGTRQGCMLSPFLFIFYLEELLAMIEEQNCKGIFIDEDNPNIPMLMYADDIVIVGDKIGEVQKNPRLLRLVL